jgi:Fe-S-cluster-containing dehydrogenase component
MARIREAGHGKRDIDHAEFTQVALDRGLVQGNSMMVIDLEACTRCDDCVRACAATHDGRPRFVREGSKLDNLLVTKSCYHCRDPVCLVGCPTGAIHRGGLAEVIDIDDEICIGCGTCANNCPYDAIVMHETGETWPGDTVPAGLRGNERLVASKCDLCHTTGHEPACVSSCPQGCLHRVGSVDEIQALRRRDR